jgi:hypothetical protein
LVWEYRECKADVPDLEAEITRECMHAVKTIDADGEAKDHSRKPPDNAPTVQHQESDKLEWSPLISYKALRTDLLISQNTLKARLVEGDKPVVGQIRYKAPPNARKIQIVVSDLPADSQTKFRRTDKQASN